MPKISIILPCYKVEKFLPSCLKTLAMQTEQDFEVICVDDGSPDNCGKILDEYAKADSRFKVIHQPNGGLSSARNAGIPFISSPYTLFVDSDDALHPQTFELILKSAETTNADMVWFDVCNFTHNEALASTPPLDFSGIEQIYYNNPLSLYAVKPLYRNSKSEKMTGVVWNKLYKTELIKSTFFEPKLSPGEDNLYMLEITAKADLLVHFKAPLYYYRCNPDSIMQTLTKEKIANNLVKEMNGYLKLQKRIMAGTLPDRKKNIIKNFVASFYFKRLFRPLAKEEDALIDRDYTENLLLNNELDFRGLSFRYRIPLAWYKRKLTKRKM